jgi:Tol biopolymer transport system component
MNERRDMDRLLRLHLAATADPTPSRGQLDALMGRVATTSQRPAWTGVLTADGRAAMGEGGRGEVRIAALLVAAMLLLALLAIGLLVGGRKDLAVNPGPVATPPAIALLPSPRALPTPTTFITPTAQPTDRGPDCTARDEHLASLGVTAGLAWGSGSPPPSGAHPTPGRIATWSANTDGPSTVDLLDPATGARTPFMDLGLTPGKYSQLAWSPDGSTLAITSSGDCGEVTLMRTSDGIVRLDPGPGTTLEAGSLEWSPDSSQVAVIPIGLAQPVGTHVWILPRDGSPKIDLGPPCAGCNTFWFRWSPDGRHLAGIYQTQGDQSTSGVAIADPSAGTWTVFPEGSVGGLLPGWRDDHRLIADLSPDGTDRFIEYDVNTGSRTVLPIHSPSTTGAFTLLRDGRHVLEFSNTGTGGNVRDSLLLLDLDTGSRRTVWMAPRGIQLGGGILAPDGSAYVMDAGHPDPAQPNDTWVIRLDGSGATKLAGIDIGDGSWQPVVH